MRDWAHVAPTRRGQPWRQRGSGVDRNNVLFVLRVGQLRLHLSLTNWGMCQLCSASRPAGRRGWVPVCTC